MITHKKFIIGFNSAIEESFKSTAKRHVGSVLLSKKGEIIATGHNSDTKKHKIMTQFPPKDKDVVYDKYIDNTKWNPKKVFLHSEASCILTALKYKLDLTGCVLIVVRTLCNGKVSMAKPCGNCMSIIKHYNIKEVIYSDWNGEMIREEVK